MRVLCVMSLVLSLNVNATFPSPVRNTAAFLFFGAGVHVPVRDRLSVFGDVRMIAGAEGRAGSWP